MTSTEATELLDRVRSGNTLRNPTLQALLAAAIEITSGLSPEQLRRKSLPADHAERLSSLDDSCRTARQTGTVPAQLPARLSAVWTDELWAAYGERPQTPPTAIYPREPQKELAHQRSMLKIHRQKYGLAQQQMALQGGPAMASAALMMMMSEAARAIVTYELSIKLLELTVPPGV